MNQIYLAQIGEILPVPDFGAQLRAHLERLNNPRARAASTTAWNLLASAVRARTGGDALPTVAFEPNGKPFFEDSALHFSLSHSRSLAAVLLSDAPCGIDIELVKENVSPALVRRVLTEAEQATEPDFYDIWTQKEAIGKRSGIGLRTDTDTLGYRHEHWLRTDIFDDDGKKYRLAALSTDQAEFLFV